MEKAPHAWRTDIEDILKRFQVLADHYPIVGTASHHDEASRAYARGWSDAFREAAAYLRDTLSQPVDPEDTD
jgi:hypothetical protein